MWRKFLIVGLVLGITMMFLSAPAWAEDMMDEEAFVSCEQADLEGNWKALAFGRSDSYGNTIWDKVDVEIDADGNVQGGKYTEYEFPKNYDPEKKLEIEKKDKYRMTGGELLVGEDCIISGYITLSNGTTYTVEQGQISMKKDQPKELVLSNQPGVLPGEI